MRVLLDLVLLLALLAPVPAFAGSVVCDPSCLTCEGPDPEQCNSCRSDSYLTGNPGTCAPCTAIDDCDVPLTCTSASTSRCTTCATEHFRIVGGDAAPDQCEPCSPVPGCESALTCTTASNSTCSACADGFFLNAPHTSCVPCTAVVGCVDLDAPNCVSATTSQCNTCASGRYLDESAPADTCPECAPVAHCSSTITCSTATDSSCTACAAPFVLVAGTCVEACTRADCSNHGDATGTHPTCTCTCDPGFHGASCDDSCTAIDFCISSITCTGPGDSQCTSCAPGHDLVEGMADTCPVAATTDIPIAGNRARLSDLPKKRQTQISSYDKEIDLMNVDPTVTGATLSLFSATATESFKLELPVSGWRGPLPGRRFRYSAPGDPKVKIVLVNARLLRITLRGPGAYPLGVAQGTVAASLTIGTTRFCTLFGGTISKDDGVRFVARKALRPDRCPVDPSANTAPVAHPNLYETVAFFVRSGLGGGGYVVGNVRTDAGPTGTDADPDGDAFSVHAVTNPTLVIAGNPVTLTATAGGVAAYTFTHDGLNATFTIASDGTVTLTGDPDIFLDLLTTETSSFDFDYTDADTIGNVSNAAHVSFVITGSNVSCIVGGRC